VVKRIAFVLNTGAASEATGTALQLMERLLALGHRVSVFAHDDAVTLSAGDSEPASAIATLLRRGVHGPAFDWVVERAAAEALGIEGRQAPGVVHGDHADLWAIVRAADIVLTPGSV
jgi:sulfur relay (sulfurtransferase) complex TusBCD TusD component (DsrE family)